jgi:hypothetical protein
LQKKLARVIKALTQLRTSDTIANIAKIEPALVDVPCTNILGLVIYDLPGRDCAAKASNGELKVGEISRYKSEYIDREKPRPQPQRPIDLVKRMRLTGRILYPSHRQDHQGPPEDGFRPSHRAGLAPQPCHQHRQGGLQEQCLGLP